MQALPISYLRPRWLIAACLSLCAGCATAPAADIVLIEEDWELVVVDPEPARFGPQVTTTLAPIGNLGGLRWRFTLNPSEQSIYDAGGMRLVLWNGTGTIATRAAHAGTPLHYTHETVTWTQRMAVENKQLTVAIVDGQSRSWGSFGDDGALSMQMRSPVPNLNQYDPWLSVVSSGLSGVFLGPTRVKSMTLVEVRQYSRAGLESQETTPVVVFAH